MVLCDSHGTQLIFKDLIKGRSSITGKQYQLAIFQEELNRVVNLFYANKIDYAILRELQLSIAGKTRAIPQSGLTRQGTQINKAESILKSKVALKTYITDPRASDLDTAKEVKETLLSDSFQDQLTAAIKVLKKVHDAVKMSESTHTTLDKVYQRWFEIQDHLNSLLEL